MKTSLFLAVALAMLPHIAFCQWVPPQPQINVTGSAEIKVAPDEITLSVGVETRDPVLNVAARQNDERVSSALAFLKQMGVPEKQVQTDFISVNPDYGPGNDLIEPRFYVTRKSIEIRLTTVTNLEAILTGLLNHGVNHVHNIDFRTTQLRKYRDQARAMAVRAAREKAEAMTKELGVGCGKPTSITANEYGGWWNWHSDWWNRGGFYGNASQNVAQSNGGNPPDSAGESLSLGQISVSATVNVAFQIE